MGPRNDNVLSVNPEQTPLLPSHLQSHLHGYILIFIASFTYPTVSLLIRYATLTHSYPSLTSLLLRSIISTTLATPFLIFIPRPCLIFSKRNITHLVTASIFGAAHFLFMYHALFYAPLATVITVQSMATPLTTVICALWLGEGVRVTEIGAFAVSTLGVILISHPSGDFGQTNTFLGIVLAILSTITSAVWFTFLRSMGDVHALIRVITLCVCIGLESALFANSTHWIAIVKFPIDTLIVSIAAVLSLLTMILFNAGMKRCRAGPGLLVYTMSVPTSFALGWLFLGESAEWFTLVGAGLVIGSAALIALQAMLDEDDV